MMRVMTKNTHFSVSCILMIATTIYLTFFMTVDAVTLKKPFSDFPHKISDWTALGDHTFDQRTMDVLRVDDFLYKTYNNGNKNVQLYVGFYRTQRNGAQIHSPKNCLPGSGWLPISEKTISQQHNSFGPLNFIVSVYQKHQSKEVFLYWYNQQEKMITNEYMLKFNMVYSSLTSNRSDAAFIRISTKVVNDNVEEAIGTAKNFMLSALQPIKSFLPSP